MPYINDQSLEVSASVVLSCLKARNHRMAAQVSILIALLGLNCQWAAGQENCYAYDTNPYLYFSIKTSYNHEKHMDRDPINLLGLFVCILKIIHLKLISVDFH